MRMIKVLLTVLTNVTKTEATNTHRTLARTHARPNNRWLYINLPGRNYKPNRRLSILCHVQARIVRAPTAVENVCLCVFERPPRQLTKLRVHADLQFTHKCRLVISYHFDSRTVIGRFRIMNLPAMH